MNEISNKASKLLSLIDSLKDSKEEYNHSINNKNAGIKQESMNEKNNITTKKSIEHELNSIIQFCKQQMSEIESASFKHPKLAELQTLYINQIKSIYVDFMNLANLIRNEIVWDHLVVAFFGETNAGKSTLIETLRLNYGTADLGSWKHSEIVGDGRADYTKVATEYDIEIDGRRVTLIDVPGIEGDEIKYAEVIEKALRKAHVVFYVQGQNIKPDAAIAKKIGRYLSDWSKVYSIYNIRNSLADYELELELAPTDNLVLKTEKYIDIQSQIQGVFKEILGDVYQGGITLQGLIGLAASSEFQESNKWSKLHANVIKIFKSRENALKFSNIEEWISLMNECSDNFEKVILDSNRQKINGLKIKGLKMIKTIEDSQNRDVDILKSRINSLKNEITTVFSNATRNVKQCPKSIINRVLSKLKSDLVEIVNSNSDSEHKVRRAKASAEKVKYELNNTLEDELTAIVDKLKQNLQKLFSEFKQIRLRIPEIPDISVDKLDLNLDDAFDNLDVSFADICNTISTMAGSATAGFVFGGAFFGPTGAIVGALVGAIGGTIGKAVMSDGGKGDAIRAIGKEIEICEKSATEKIMQSTCVIISELQVSQKQTVQILENELASLNELSGFLSIIYQKFTIRK